MSDMGDRLRAYMSSALVQDPVLTDLVEESRRSGQGRGMRSSVLKSKGLANELTSILFVSEFEGHHTYLGGSCGCGSSYCLERNSVGVVEDRLRGVHSRWQHIQCCNL